MRTAAAVHSCPSAALRPARLRMGASGNVLRSDGGLGTDPGSSFASADLSGVSLGALRNLSPLITLRAAAIAAACSSSVRSIARNRVVSDHPIYGQS